MRKYSEAYCKWQCIRICLGMVFSRNYDSLLGLETIGIAHPWPPLTNLGWRTSRSWCVLRYTLLFSVIYFLIGGAINFFKGSTKVIFTILVRIRNPVKPISYEKFLHTVGYIQSIEQAGIEELRTLGGLGLFCRWTNLVDSVSEGFLSISPFTTSDSCSFCFYSI